MFIVSLMLALLFTLSQDAFAYLDPGTGSYVFQALFAIFLSAIFTFKMYWRKIKYFFSKHFFEKSEK